MSKDIEVTSHYFKTHFSAFMRDLETGRYDRIVVKRNKKPVGVFSLPERKPPERKLGLLEGQLKFDKKAWDSMDEDIARDFYDENG